MSKSIEERNLSIYNIDKIVDAYSKWKEISSAERISLSFSKQIEPKILDIGCGTGRHHEYFENLDANYLGIDISEKMIVKAKMEYGEEFFQNTNILEFNTLNKFDTIILMHNGLDIFYPLVRRKKVITKIKSLMKPDGKFIFSSHLPNWSINKKNKSQSSKFSFQSIYYSLIGVQKGYLPEDYRGNIIYQYRASSIEIRRQMNKLGFKVDVIIPDYLKDPVDWNYYVCSLK